MGVIFEIWYKIKNKNLSLKEFKYYSLFQIKIKNNLESAIFKILFKT